MCGRYTLAGKPVDLEKQLRAQLREDAHKILTQPSFNIAPSAAVPAVLDHSPEWIVPVKWGLRPVWTKPGEKPRLLINIREDSLRLKPGFKRYLKQKHCLIPASGFYEWQTNSGIKQPYYIKLKEQDFFCFAGLYEEYRDAEGHLQITVSLLTTEPNALMLPIHDRMPVILAPHDYANWLNCDKLEHPEVMFLPYPAVQMEAWPVSARVNSPRNNDADLINRVEISNNNNQLGLFS